MRSLVLFLIMQMLSQNAFPRDFLDRFVDTTIIAGYLVIPVPEESFVLLDNEIVRSRLFYDNHFHEYKSYSDFLEELMNHPGSIDVTQDLGLTRKEHINEKLQRESHLDFKRFKRKYLKRIDPEGTVFEVKNRFHKKERQVLKICFDNGYYLYWTDVYAKWIIASHPISLPPDMNSVFY